MESDGTVISHVQLNVSDLEKSSDFYLSVLAPLGFSRADQSAGQYVRLSNGRNAVFVLCPVGGAYRQYVYHRKGIGLGHVAFAAESREMVDRMEDHLAALGISLLGQGKLASDYRRGYYSLCFEDPDRIMIEIVHCSPYYYSLSPP